MISLKEAELLNRLKSGPLVEAGLNESDAELLNDVCVTLVKAVFSMTEHQPARDKALQCMSEIRSSVVEAYNARWT